MNIRDLPDPGGATRALDTLRLFADHLKRETIVVVHGTFANPGRGAPADPAPPAPWWDGSFCSRLDAALAERGSAARCWNPWVWLLDSRAPPNLHLDNTFSWTGENSEFARRAGAAELARYLDTLERHDGVARYHVVAHSHGGNVFRRAAWLMATTPSKIGRVVYLGTPFLHFADRRGIWYLLRRIHWVLLFLLALAFWLVVRWTEGSSDQVTAWTLSIVLAGVGSVLLFYFREAREAHARVPAVALCFEVDEAVALLKQCAAFAARPELLLRQLFGSSSDAGGDSLFERTVGKARRTPLVGGLLHTLGALALVMFVKPYRPRLRPLLVSRLPRLRASMLYFVERGIVDKLPSDATRSNELVPSRSSADPLRMLHGFGVGIASLGSAGAYFVLWPIDLLLGVGPWLAEVASRMAMWIGIRAMAKTAFGMDVIGAGFRSHATGRTPEEVQQLSIPHEIELDLLRRVGEGERDLGKHLRRVIGTEDASVLVGAVKHVLSDSKLLHAQYYQDDRVISYVAELIAAAPSDELRKWTVVREAEARP